jgi:DNA modification methylase
MNEPTTPPDSPGPMPGKLRKRRSTEKPWHHKALQLYLKDCSLKRVADAIGRSKKVTDHFWCGARDQGDVWFFDKPVANDLHPPMKPVELIARAIRNSSRSGDLVLVPFGGPGSTVIACEKTGRLARLGEIDPIYVDVTIYRWQKFTGTRLCCPATAAPSPRSLDPESGLKVRA